MPAQDVPQPSLRPAHPPSTLLTELATSISATLRAQVGASTSAVTGVAVTGVELRAQAIAPGDLFAALPGAKAHGAEFAPTAIEQGAVAVLTDIDGARIFDEVIGGRSSVPLIVHAQPRSILGELSATIYGRPSERMQVIGITGTSGKTTTAYLVEAGLSAGGRKPGLIGTIETRIEGRRVPSALTTPEAPQLHAMFAAMLEQGIDSVVMEVSSHALTLGRVDGTRFEIGVFTNLSQDHLDFHPSFDDYFVAKARLFEVGSPVRAQRAVVCIDDKWGVRMAAAALHPLTVSVSSSADWTASNVVAVGGGGQTFDASGPESLVHGQLRLSGRYNIANALLAIATCTTAGIDAAVVADALGSVDVPGRVERVDRGQGFLAVVDYAHKPAALEAVIETLRGHSLGRVAVVVGAGGDRDTAKRPLMGEVAARRSDLVVITDDNPRSEDPAVIRAAVKAGADAVPDAQRAEVREVADRAAAITAAVAWARPGDVVLIAGKGHETGQEIHSVKHPFDDREVLATALEGLRGGAR